MEFAGYTDVGAVRDLNEDAVLASAPVFLVADGMGGHAAGEVASALAVQELGRLAGVTDLSPDRVLDAIDATNQAIVDWTRDHPETAGMGTTVSGVALGQVGGTPHWFVFNVGDSRVYRCTGGVLTQVTIDHSEVEEMVIAGQLTRDEARTHPRRNVVTRSLGTVPAPIADIWVLPVQPGDTFVVCSDGLPAEVDDRQMTEILRTHPMPAEAAACLIATAIGAGARDNVSAVVVSVPHQDMPGPADVTTAPRRRLPEVEV